MTTTSTMIVVSDIKGRIKVKNPLSRAEKLGWVALSDTELLICSQHYPLCVIDASCGPIVGATLSSPELRTPISQRQKSIYFPIGLRTHPFVAPSGSSNTPKDLQISSDDFKIVAGETTSGELTLISDDGTPSAALTTIHGLLEQLTAGKQKLQDAANQLIIANLLKCSSDEPQFTLNYAAFRDISEARLLALTRTCALAVELAVALEFSQRHLAATRVAATLPTDEVNSAGHIEWLSPWLDFGELLALPDEM